MTDQMLGVMQWDLGGDSGVTTSLSRSFREGKTHGGVKVRMGRSGLNATVSATNRFTDKAHGKMAIKWDIVNGIEVETSAMRNVGDLNRMGLGVSIGMSGISLTLRMIRSGQKIVLPIVLAQIFDPVVAALAIGIPSAIAGLILKFFVWPSEAKKDEEEVQRRNAEREEEIAQAREKALVEQSLMTDLVRNRKTAELARGGLVIEKALYGYFPAEAASSSDNLDMEVTTDVTVPLQYLVDNSELHLPAKADKGHLDGFHDPCPDKVKELRIWYSFRGSPHFCIMGDKDDVHIPKDSHRVSL
jgi:DnaJ family protein C protein 11